MELLVVVTIIVILIAMLVPALDRAVYQAELAVCGARLHRVVMGLQTYAMDQRRYYPPRLLPVRNGAEPNQPGSDLDQGASQSDDRPAMRRALGPLNPVLQCPLTGAIDIDEEILGGIWSTTDLWFSWTYRGGPSERGSNRMGSPFTWTEEGESGNNVRRFDVLASDADIEWTATQPQRVAHPDKWDVTHNEVVQEKPQAVAPGAATQTYSWWTSSPSGQTRGPVDLNFALADGSVQRYVDVLPRDSRLVQVPALSDVTSQGGMGSFYRQLPR